MTLALDEGTRVCLAEFGVDLILVIPPLNGRPAGVRRWMRTLDDLRLNHKAALLAGINQCDAVPSIPEDFGDWAIDYVRRNPEFAHLLPQICSEDEL